MLENQSKNRKAHIDNKEKHKTFEQRYADYYGNDSEKASISQSEEVD